MHVMMYQFYSFPPPTTNTDTTMLKTDKILLYSGKEGQNEALKCLEHNSKPSILSNIERILQRSCNRHLLSY